MEEKSIYRRTRTEVKKRLNHVVELLGMEYAIKATTPVSVAEAEIALTEYLAERDFHVLAEIDVQDLHEHYNFQYPAYRILKVAHGSTFRTCPMASEALAADPGMSVFLPPSVVVYELDGETHVSAIRPSTLLALFDDPDVRRIIRELEGALWDALDEGVPESTMVSEEPPVRPGEEERRAAIKQSLYYVLKLVDAEYSIHVSTDRPRGEVEQAIRKSLAHRGQHVLATVGERDVLLVLNPGQAHKALAIDPDVGVFAPLSVGIYEADGRTHVRCVRPTTLLIFFTQPDLQDILMEMEMLLWNSLVEGVPDARVHSRQPPLPPNTGQRTTAAGLPGGLGTARNAKR